MVSFITPFPLTTIGLSRNAVKNIDYDAVASGSTSWASNSSDDGADSPAGLRATRSLDLPPPTPPSTPTRPASGSAAALRARSTNSAAPSASPAPRTSPSPPPPGRPARPAPPPTSSPILSPTSPVPTARVQEAAADVAERPKAEIRPAVDGGIRGTRPPILTTPAPAMPSLPLKTPPSAGLPLPPARSRLSPNPSPSSVLAPPPSMSLPVMDRAGSTWDLVKSFAPEENEEGKRRGVDSDDEEEEEKEDSEARKRTEEVEEEVRGLRLGETSEELMVISVGEAAGLGGKGSETPSPAELVRISSTG